MTAFQEQFEEIERLIWRVSVTESQRKEIYYIAWILLIYNLLMIL